MMSSRPPVTDCACTAAVVNVGGQVGIAPPPTVENDQFAVMSPTSPPPHAASDASARVDTTKTSFRIRTLLSLTISVVYNLQSVDRDADVVERSDLIAILDRLCAVDQRGADCLTSGVERRHRH